MKLRLLTGVALAIGVSLLVLKLEAFWLKAIILCLSVLAVWEAAEMFQSQGLKKSDQFFLMLLNAIILGGLFYLDPTWTYLYLAFAWILLFAWQMLRLPQELKDAFPRFLSSTFIVFFFSLLFGFLGLI
ncbi:MAG: phosphatidate cytidylyltransferase, partial [Deltaproteobacteria bacterium]|nr:phosphatidate cytidylyltransferase [Deltaproteobacteria bacterium]